MLPATFSSQVTAWGWQAARLSVAPLIVWVEHPIDNLDMALLALRKKRAALVCATLALASMIYGGFAVPQVQSQLVRTPAGHLGAGYYVWVLSAALLLWTAFSSRSER